MSKSNDLLEQMRSNAARSAFYRDDVEVSFAPTDPKVRLIAYYLPSFIRSPKMISGGAKVLRNGPMSERLCAFRWGITSRVCRANLDFTI